MPERGGVGAARPCWPPRLAVIDPVSACLNGFAADIMGSYTHYPPHQAGWYRALHGGYVNRRRLDPDKPRGCPRRGADGHRP
jgi:hypothetical protein